MNSFYDVKDVKEDQHVLLNFPKELLLTERGEVFWPGSKNKDVEDRIDVIDNKVFQGGEPNRVLFSDKHVENVNLCDEGNYVAEEGYILITFIKKEPMKSN